MTPDRISDNFVHRDFVVSQAVELEAVSEKIEVMRVHITDSGKEENIPTRNYAESHFKTPWQTLDQFAQVPRATAFGRCAAGDGLICKSAKVTLRHDTSCGKSRVATLTCTI